MDVKFWSGNVTSKTTWEDLGIDGRTIVKRIVNERGMRVKVNVAEKHQTERHWSIFLWTHIFWLQLFVSTAQYGSLQLLQVAAQVLFIFQSQFLVDNVQVPDWIHLTLNVGHIFVLERSWS